MFATFLQHVCNIGCIFATFLQYFGNIGCICATLLQQFCNIFAIFLQHFCNIFAISEARGTEAPKLRSSELERCRGRKDQMVSKQVNLAES